jgi:protein gp37
MGKTSIEWTDASWNPIVGCTEISPGCANCYAARLAATRLYSHPSYKNLANMTLDKGEFELKDRKPRWNGEVRFLPDRLEEPLHWRKPRRIFVCDMGDLFHESVQYGWITEIFSVMKHCSWHTFQILTKRPQRMREWLTNGIIESMVTQCDPVKTWPLPNVWLGVSVENQHFADERIPLLLETPAAVRWISAEPLLGMIQPLLGTEGLDGQKLDWVVCGGESGSNARPMHPGWARSLRDQCQGAGVPFFFKQWGEHIPCDQFYGGPGDGVRCCPCGKHTERAAGRHGVDHPLQFVKVGKKRAGRLLDGREWSEFPNLRYTGRFA